MIVQNILRSGCSRRSFVFFPMIVQNILRSGCSRRSFVFFPRPTSLTCYYYIKYPPPIHIQNLQIPSFSSLKPTPPSAIGVRFVSTSKSTSSQDHRHQHPLNYEEEIEEGETTDGWEEEDEAEPEVGDGGDGGGVVLQGVSWGERALSIAHEVLLQFGNDMNIYAFKTTPRGYVYVRLDKMSNKYGCPSMEELETYSQEYKKKLDEVGAQGEIPDDLALEVSTPGAERILKVPDDLSRFKDLPVTVCYEDAESDCTEKDGVFLLENIEMDSESCIWKLADVKENRDPLSKGRPLSRKQKDWRIKLPFVKHKKVTLYLEY